MGFLFECLTLYHEKRIPYLPATGQYKTRTTDYGLGIKHGLGIKRGLSITDWV